MTKKRQIGKTANKDNKRPSKGNWKTANVSRDRKTGQFVSVRSDKNARVLAATVGGAIIGNLIVPGIGGAILGGIAGAFVGNSTDVDGDSKNE